MVRGVRDAAADRRPVPDEVPARVRADVAAAADRRRRRGHPRAPARRDRRGRPRGDLGGRRLPRPGAVRRAAGGRAGDDGRGRRGRGAAVMSVEWYLVVSAIVFSIGMSGVIVRRNPLVILLCLELMLNAGNLALVALPRMHGNQAGQIFALIVMVVAACEVAIGLGLIVALYRRRLPIDVDELRELQG